MICPGLYNGVQRSCCVQLGHLPQCALLGGAVKPHLHRQRPLADAPTSTAGMFRALVLDGSLSEDMSLVAIKACAGLTNFMLRCLFARLYKRVNADGLIWFKKINTLFNSVLESNWVAPRHEHYTPADSCSRSTRFASGSRRCRYAPPLVSVLGGSGSNRSTARHPGRYLLRPPRRN